MPFAIDDDIWRVLRVYEAANLPLPEARAFALRLLEEAVELCLANGASIMDIVGSVNAAKVNEHAKQPSRTYEQKDHASHGDRAGEIADVALLLGCVAAVSDVGDEEVMRAATEKVDRLAAAQKAGTLHFTADGRFYRRKP